MPCSYLWKFLTHKYHGNRIISVATSWIFCGPHVETRRAAVKDHLLWWHFLRYQWALRLLVLSVLMGKPILENSWFESDTLPKLKHLKMDGWKMNFLLGRPISESHIMIVRIKHQPCTEKSAKASSDNGGTTSASKLRHGQTMSDQLFSGFSLQISSKPCFARKTSRQILRCLVQILILLLTYAHSPLYSL